MVCKLSKKVHLLQFCADLSKKYRSVKAIYIYASESSHDTLSENPMIATVDEILAITLSKKTMNQQKFNKILRVQTLISPKQ